MLQSEIQVGEIYWARVSGNLVKVRVENIDGMTVRGRSRKMYYVKNLSTGRDVTFKSAMKFRKKVVEQEGKM